MSDIDRITRALMEGTESEELIATYGIDAVNDAVTELEGRI